MATQINNPSDGKCGYIAFYGSRSAEVYANSMLQAKELAINFFGTPKSKQHMLSVVLAENGKQVETTIT